MRIHLTKSHNTAHCGKVILDGTITKNKNIVDCKGCLNAYRNSRNGDQLKVHFLKKPKTGLCNKYARDECATKETEKVTCKICLRSLKEYRYR